MTGLTGGLKIKDELSWEEMGRLEEQAKKAKEEKKKKKRSFLRKLFKRDQIINFYLANTFISCYNNYTKLIPFEVSKFAQKRGGRHDTDRV